MRSFLEVRRGRQLQPSTFPEAILNGTQLDLNALYRAVCSRGGYAMGTGVNWAGQVCNSLCIHSSFHWTIALFISLAKLARVQAVQLSCTTAQDYLSYSFLCGIIHARGQISAFSVLVRAFVSTFAFGLVATILQ